MVDVVELFLPLRKVEGAVYLGRYDSHILADWHQLFHGLYHFFSLIGRFFLNSYTILALVIIIRENH